MSAVPLPGYLAANGALLDGVQRLHPVRGLLHVGAGDSVDDLPYVGWDVPFALLVEADDERCARLAETVQVRSGWKAVHALVDAQPGAVGFHVASNPRESGILDPQLLRSVWRNLHGLETRPLVAVPVHSLLAELTAAQAVNWVFVDCMPAVRLLQGLASWSGAFDVLVVRALLASGPASMAQADADSIAALMKTQSFRQVALLPDAHPAIGQMVFVRDWRAWQAPRLLSLESELRSDRAAKAATLAELQQLQQRADEKALLHASAMAALREQLRGVQAGLEARVAALQSSNETLAAQVAAGEAAMALQRSELDARATAIAAGETTISSQLSLMAEHSGLIDEGVRRVEALETERGRMAQQLSALGDTVARLEDELAHARRALAQQTQERDALQQHLGEAEARHARERDALQQRLGETEALHAQERDALQQRLGEAEARLAQEQGRQADGLAEQKRQTIYWMQSHEAGSLRIAELEQERATQLAALSRLEVELQGARDALSAGQGRQSDLESDLDGVRRKLEQSALERTALEQQLRDAEAMLAQHREHRDGDLQEQAKQLAELVEQRRQTMYWKESQEAGKQREAGLAQQLASLGQRLDEHDRQMSQLTRERDEHARVSGERLRHIEDLTRTAEAHGARVSQLERERAELEARQRLLDQEIVKAEAQIDLIKDVVLREKAF